MITKFVVWFFVVVLGMHRHKWTRWSAVACSDHNVRHCIVCGRKEYR